MGVRGMRRAGLWAVLSLGVSLHQVALADAIEIPDDVRCIFVGLQAVQSTDPAVQQSAVVVAMYFLGRLESIAPQANLEELLMKESVSMSKPTVFQAEAARCSLALKDKGKLMQEVGNHLLLRGREMLDKPASPLP
jgi:hypothetical protein